MSEMTIFIIGSIIFAITIYGSVMGGGIALGRLADSQDEVLHEPDEGPTVTSDLPNQAS